MEVTLDTIFGEVLEEYPETEEVLKNYMGEAYCLTCPGKMFDTIGNGVLLHGLSDQMTQWLMEDLQQVVDAYENGTPFPPLRKIDAAGIAEWDGNFQPAIGTTPATEVVESDEAEIDTSGVDIDHMFAAAIKELEAQEKEDAARSTQEQA